MAVLKRADKIFKYLGFFLKSDLFKRHDKDQDVHIFAIVGGQLIRKPTTRIFKNGNKKTDFAIRYMNGGHIIVHIWSDTPIAKEASYLDQFSRVIAFGTITRHQYVNKRGEHRETRFMHPFCVIPVDKLLDVITFVSRLMNSPTIKKILDNDEEDVMESAAEFGIVEEVTDDDVAESYEDLFV